MTNMEKQLSDKYEENINRRVHVFKKKCMLRV